MKSQAETDRDPRGAQQSGAGVWNGLAARKSAEAENSARLMAEAKRSAGAGMPVMARAENAASSGKIASGDAMVSFGTAASARDSGSAVSFGKVAGAENLAAAGGRNAVAENAAGLANATDVRDFESATGFGGVAGAENAKNTVGAARATGANDAAEEKILGSLENVRGAKDTANTDGSMRIANAGSLSNVAETGSLSDAKNANKAQRAGNSVNAGNLEAKVGNLAAAGVKNAGNVVNAAGEKKSGVEFSAREIGRWGARQESPFAAQNRERNAERVKKSARRAKALPIIKWAAIIAGAVLVVGGIVWLIVAVINREPDQPKLPTEDSFALAPVEDFEDYVDSLNQLYESHAQASDDEDEAAASAASEALGMAVAGTLSTEAGLERQNEILMAQLEILFMHFDYLAVMNLANQIDPEGLTLDQKIDYYGYLTTSAGELGYIDDVDNYHREYVKYYLEKEGTFR